MFLQLQDKPFHDMLLTFMAEEAVIIIAITAPLIQWVDIVIFPAEFQTSIYTTGGKFSTCPSNF